MNKIEIKDDPDNCNVVIVVKDGEAIGKVSRFNNGFTKDGYPLPLE